MRYRILIFMKRIGPLGAPLALALALTLALAAFADPALPPSPPQPASASEDDAPAADADIPVQDEIRIEAGPIRGRRSRSDNVRVFKGIPYAAPPVGPLRWKPPEPVVPWIAARDCTAFSAVCPQPRPLMYRPLSPQSEDCLYLNVWTGARKRGDGLPVLVWIHGGAFAIGGASRPPFDGEALAREKAVVVTLNYRLGPFGFFAHPLLSAESPQGSSGNYGLMDQVAALEWVQRNIRSFGGDPDNVTLFGESAGAASVARLMVVPAASGLFHRAALHSGGVRGRVRRLRESAADSPAAEAIGQELAARLGCDTAADPLAALRAKSAAELLQAADPMQGLFDAGTRFLPVVDGSFLPEDPARLWAEGRAAAVPLLIGTCENEGSIFVAELGINRGVTYPEALKRLYGERAPTLARRYPALDKGQMRENLDRFLTAALFLLPAREMAAWHAGGAPTWRFHFTRVSRVAYTLTLGAHHGAEIPYLFGTLGEKNRQEPDEELSRQMTAAWVRFARTGDPNGGELPAWAPWEAAQDNYLEFGPQIRAGAGLRTADIEEFRITPGE